MNTTPHDDARDYLHLRDYRPEDLPGVISVIQSVYDDLNYTLDFDNFDRDLADVPGTYIDSGGAFWVLEEETDIAGTIGVVPKDAESCELRRLYLKRTYRGRGWGRRLVKHVIDWAGSHGYRRIFLWSDVLLEAAHHVYVKSGFSPTAKTRAVDPTNPTSVERYFILEK